MFTTRQKRIFLGLMIGTLSFNSFSYAQEEPQVCITCSTMASELQDYITFANQMVDALQVKSNIISNGSSYNVYGPRQGGTYNGILIDKNPSGLIQNIVLGTLKNIDRRQSYLRSTTEVLSIYTIDIIKDGALGFLVTTQPRPIMRDFQYLLDIDTLISDKIYDLGRIGAQGKQLTNEERNAIIQIINNNTGEGKLFEDNAKRNIDPALSSTDVLRILLRINNRNKKVLTLSTKNIDNSVTANKTTLYLSNIYYNTIVQKYQCARIGGKNQCGGSRENFKKSIDNITKSFIQSGPKQSREKINKSYKRLITRGKIIIGSENINEKNLKDYLAREHELITSRGEGKQLTKRTGRGILTGAISSNIPRLAKQEWNELLKLGNEISNIWKDKKEILKQDSNFSNLTNKQQQTQQFPITTQQYVISNSLGNIIKKHYEAQKNDLNVSSSESIEALSKITDRIKNINEILINNIRTDLTRTCNLQCSNLGGICG